MKFALKYPNQKRRDPVNEDDLLVGNEEPCHICGEPTHFVEICSEGHFCSEECLSKFWDWCNEHCYPVEEPDDIPEPKIEPSKIVLVEPGEVARITEMELTLENMQKTVSGLIQAIYPWKDKTALVCNDEGKLLNLPLNRSLEDENGQVYDIIAGTFFICGLTEDNFGSLTDEQATLYLEKFLKPQIFVPRPNGELAILTCRVSEEDK